MLLQKILLSGALIATAVTTQAVSPDKTFEESAALDIIPACFAHNGEPSLYFGTDRDDYQVSNKFKLYSRTFEEKGYVEFPLQTYTETQKFQYNLPIINYFYDENTRGPGFSLESAKELAETYNLYDQIQVGGVYYFFVEGYLPEDCSNLTTIADVEKYLLEQPWENLRGYDNTYFCYAVYSPTTGVYTEYSFDECKIVGYSDVYEESETESWEYPTDIRTLHVRDMEDDREFYDSFVITQSLFNNDEDYEALIPNYEMYTTTEDEEYGFNIPTPGRDAYFYIPAKRITTNGVVRSLNVTKGNSGEVIATFEIPNEYNLDGCGANLYIDGENKQLLIYGGDLNLKKEVFMIYELPKSGAGGVQSPKLIETVKIRPSVVRQGEEISVEAGDNTEIEAVTVTDMKGATRRVASNAGKHSATINSGRLSRGMHIVGVETADGTQSSKVIVR